LSANLIDKNNLKVQVFDTEQQSEIRTICPVDDVTAWIVYEADDNVILIDNVGKTLKKIHVDHQVLDLSLRRNGDLLITPWGGMTLCIMANNGKVNKWLNFSPSHVKGVHALQNNETLVTLQENANHRLLRISTSGQVIQKIEYDKDGSKLFHLPGKMTVFPNDNILVTCYSRIVAVDTKGNHLYTIKEFAGDKLSAYDVTCDEEGRVFITERVAGKLYVMNKDGGGVQTVLDSSNGLSKPNGVAAGTSRCLWLGNGNGKIFLVNY